ncbi:isochorismate synthase [Flavobacteriaceae bacterium R38]|nr:isochorismate synthase [Flavobacteriaceae bacterium R38]
MLSLEVFYKNIEEQLQKKLPFVVYSKPNENQVSAILQSNNTLNESKDFRETGFVFAPFDDGDTVLIPKDSFLKTLLTSETESLTVETDFISDKTDEQQHKELIKKGINSIKKEQFEKVVLSRVERIKNHDIDVIEKYQGLVSIYPSAFSYLWYHPKVGLWLGATPETLLEVKEDEFYTMALAGTKLFQNDSEIVWGEKEIAEQQIVTDTIVSSLNNIEEIQNLNISSRKTVKAGSLLHLKTDIKGKIGTASIKEIVSALHPTPAVCGFPREEARSFILENENYNRSYYTGFLGELNMTSESSSQERFSSLYVNLRCMQVEETCISIYTGGGITLDSHPEAEWQEVLNKTRTMKKVIF